MSRRGEARDIRIAAATWELSGGSRALADRLREEADLHERPSPPPHAHLDGWEDARAVMASLGYHMEIDPVLGVRWLPASPPPHAHPRDEFAVLAHPARGAVGDEEREAQGGPRGDDVG